jgi:hypothetical protein
MRGERGGLLSARVIGSRHGEIPFHRFAVLALVLRAANTERVDLCAELNGRAPKVGIEVSIGEVFLHCPKALKRSRLWDPSQHADGGSCGVDCSMPSRSKRADVGARLPYPTSARYGPSGISTCSSIWIAGRGASMAMPRTPLPCRLVTL